MALDATGYFHHLKSYLNMDFYAIHPNMHGELSLKETIFTSDGEVNQSITLNISGEAFAIKLDARESARPKNKGKQHPLFHFLNDEGKPWSKRCDFVIFQLYRKSIRVYCLEYKYKSIPVESAMAQLKASENWCRALYATINIYTGQKRKLKLTKYVLSCCDEDRVGAYLDAENKYLTRDPSVRHYPYSEIDGQQLHELEHATIEAIG